jgi:hypothetical protein
MASMAARSGTRGLWHPSGCGLRGGSSGCISAQSASGILQPSSLTRFMRGALPRRSPMIKHARQEIRSFQIKISGFSEASY